MAEILHNTSRYTLKIIKKLSDATASESFFLSQKLLSRSSQVFLFNICYRVLVIVADDRIGNGF